MVDNSVLVLVGAIFGSGGAGAAAVKWMLNGSREGIRRIEQKVDKQSTLLEQHGVLLSEHGERLAHVEGMLERRR